MVPIRKELDSIYTGHVPRMVKRHNCRRIGILTKHLYTAVRVGFETAHVLCEIIVTEVLATGE